MNLLDQAVKMAAEADEPLEMNFVRKHALQQAEEMGINLRQAATRVFSNASGSYSSNINLAVENSTWESEAELQEMYLTRKSFAFSADNPGTMEQTRQIFESTLKTAEVTFQNLDSSEISLTDVSHYFDSDPTKVLSSLRGDGKTPASYIADTTTATMGWSATAGAVDNWIYEDTNATFIQDEAMRQRLMNLNPHSFRKMVATLLEVNGRGYWETSESNLDLLRELYQEVEDRIEGIE